jgi:xylose isomerase
VNNEEINILGNIINDGWGRSSEEAAGAFKVISKITSIDSMSITCMIVVNLLNRQEMQKECSKAYEQCKKACNETLKQIKKDFKAMSGRNLKSKEKGHDESVELISMSSYSPKGTALVRCIYNFEVK